VFFEGETRPRAVLRSLEINEPILLKKVTEPGVDAGITANLTPGMRALAINVDVSTGVSGFLRPNDRVDVYWSGNANGVKSPSSSRPACA
jgi:pilus assembly protein CpaB